MKKIILALSFFLPFAAVADTFRADTNTFGRPVAGNKTIILDNNATTANPRIRWNNTSGVLESSNDNSVYYDMSGPKNLDQIRNRLYNSDFQLWQRGTSVTVANAASTYQADRWYVKNSLGTNGVITYSQVAGVTNGSLFGAKVQITTAPTAAQTNGTELYQTLENMDSKDFYGKTASFTILVKAFGNVTSAGVQFYYKTTEAKVDTGIGAEQTCTVNTSTFVTCRISAQAMGTSQTSAGVVGVRIRIVGVSSGNTYDLNNGFVVEQAMMNVAAYASTYSRMFPSIGVELAACQRYYEKSYGPTTAPATAGVGDGLRTFGNMSTVNANMFGWVGYVVRKRTGGTVVVYPYTTGTNTGRVSDASSGTDLAASSGGTIFASTAGFSLQNNSGGTIAQTISFHFSCDAEI